MKPTKDIVSEYDFSRGVRGKYAAAYTKGSNVVVLSPDVSEYFTDSENVNEALRSLIKVASKNVGGVYTKLRRRAHNKRLQRTPARAARGRR